MWWQIARRVNRTNWTASWRSENHVDLSIWASTVRACSHCSWFSTVRILCQQSSPTCSSDPEICLTATAVARGLQSVGVWINLSPYSRRPPDVQHRRRPAMKSTINFNDDFPSIFRYRLSALARWRPAGHTVLETPTIVASSRLAFWHSP